MRSVLFLAWCLWSTGCVDVSADEDNDSMLYETIDATCEAAIVDPVLPRDVCDSSGITNLLPGTCWWEQCRDNEKSLFAKLSGVPCMLMPSSGGSPWIEGTCDGNGVCVGSGP